jgi:hypothetical protein
VVPFSLTLEKPSTARCGRRARETLRNTCTPSGDHICTTRSSLPGPARPFLRFGVRQRRAGTQRQRHLLHVVVEDLVGVVERRAVGDRGLRQRGQGDGRQQEPQQAPAQRVGHLHAFGTM